MDNKNHAFIKRPKYFFPSGLLKCRHMFLCWFCLFFCSSSGVSLFDQFSLPHSIRLVCLYIGYSFVYRRDKHLPKCMYVWVCQKNAWPLWRNCIHLLCVFFCVLVKTITFAEYQEIPKHKWYVAKSIIRMSSTKCMSPTNPQHQSPSRARRYHVVCERRILNAGRPGRGSDHGRTRVRQLRCNFDAIVATRRHWPLSVQCVRTLPQNERHE